MQLKSQSQISPFTLMIYLVSIEFVTSVVCYIKSLIDCFSLFSPFGWKIPQRKFALDKAVGL